MSRVHWTGDKRLYVHNAVDGLQMSVLRRTCGDLQNDTRSWVLPKLNLTPEFGRSRSDRMGAVRWDVVLPAEAPESCSDPIALCDQYKHEACSRQKDLVNRCKLTIATTGALHAWWEAPRHFVVDKLVGNHQLAVVMALHNPRATGYRGASPPHIHVLALARELDERGFGEATRLARDDARYELAEPGRTPNNVLDFNFRGGGQTKG